MSTAALYLHRIVLADPGGLHRLVRDQIRDHQGKGLPDHPFDAGYVTHVLLRSLFGDLAPSVFCADRAGILAYAATDTQALQRRAQEGALPEVYACVNWGLLVAKPMPTTWPEGHLMGFRLRACPVVRGPKGHGAKPGLIPHHPTPEVDAYLARSWRQTPAPPREQVYQEWLDSQLRTRAGATLVAARILSFRLTHLLRRTQGQGAGRTARGLTRPDVLFEGTLRVEDPARFGTALAHGIGRHRSFGYGMLLLRAVKGT